MDRLFAFILRRLCKVLHGMSNAQISDAYTQRVLMYCCSANVKIEPIRLRRFRRAMSRVLIVFIPKGLLSLRPSVHGPLDH